MSEKQPQKASTMLHWWLNKGGDADTIFDIARSDVMEIRDMVRDLERQLAEAEADVARLDHLQEALRTCAYGKGQGYRLLDVDPDTLHYPTIRAAIDADMAAREPEPDTGEDLVAAYEAEQAAEGDVGSVADAECALWLETHPPGVQQRSDGRWITARMFGRMKSHETAREAVAAAISWDRAVVARAEGDGLPASAEAWEEDREAPGPAAALGAAAVAIGDMAVECGDGEEAEWCVAMAETLMRIAETLLDSKEEVVETDALRRLLGGLSADESEEASPDA